MYNVHSYVGQQKPISQNRKQKTERIIKEIGFDLANAGAKSIKLPSVLKVKNLKVFSTENNLSRLFHER